MLTLGTQRDLTNDMLIKGIIDSVVTVNQFYQMLPFKGIEGNALAYNREGAGDQQSLTSILNSGHDSAFSNISPTINKDQQVFTRHSTELTTLIGDAQVNGLVQAVGSDFHDATAVQVAAKAKGIGRRYMNLLIHGNEGVYKVGDTASLTDVRTILAAANAEVAGDVVTATTTIIAATIISLSPHTGTVRSIISENLGTFSTPTFTLDAGGVRLLNAAVSIVSGNTGFDGLNAFVASADGQDRTGDHTTVVTGGALLGRMDEYIDSIHDKDGMVDYIMMNSGGVRKMTAAFRLVGSGFDMMDVKTSSGGVMAVQSYRGIPIFRNDFVGTHKTDSSTLVDRADQLGGDGAKSINGTTLFDDIYVGTMDDGSMTHGICGLTAKKSAGMQVQKLGAREDVDADITRVKWYCGLAHFSTLGLLRGAI